MRLRELGVSKYHAPLVIIVWDVHQGDGDRVNAQWIVENLEHAGIPTLRLSASLPALHLDRYYNPPLDGHPTGEAYGLLSNTLKVFLDANLRSGITHATDN